MLRTAVSFRCSWPPTIRRGFLSILTVDFPSLLRSSVNLTFGRKWCVGLMRRIDLITFRSPYLLPHCGFPFSASQLGKSYVRKKVMQWICRRFTPPSSTALLTRYPGRIGSHTKKRHTLRCAFNLISGFLSSQTVSSQVLSAFMSLTTVFEMGTGGSS